MIKICSSCGKEFESKSGRHENTQIYCSVNCQARAWRKNNPEKVKETDKRWRDNNPEKHYIKLRKAMLKRKYGITLDEYNDMLEKQNGVCAICGQAKNETLAVDHDHKTGKIRGLLCGHCNHVVGFAKDNIDILDKTILYLNS